MSCALNAGDLIPGDCLILESKDLFVDEATLTGETYPVEKMAGRAAGGHAAGEADQHAVHGDARGQRQRPARWSRHTGRQTEFGKVSERLPLQAAGDRIRARGPALRLPAHGSHAGAGDRSSSPSTSTWPARCWTPSSSRWRWPSG